MCLYLTILCLTMLFSVIEFNYRVTRGQKKLIMLLWSALFFFLSAIRTVQTGDLAAYEQVVLAAFAMLLQYKVAAYWGDQLSACGNGNSYELTVWFLLWVMYFGNIFAAQSALSLLLCLYSVRYIEKKRVLPFLICVAAASLFHYGSISFLCAYVVYHYKGSIRSKAVLLVVGSVLGACLCSHGISWVGRLIPSLIHDMRALKSAVNMAAVLFLCFYLLSRKFEHNHLINGYINLYLFGAIIYISTWTSSFDFGGAAQYYNAFQIPVFLWFFKLHEESRNKRLYLSAFYVYLCLRFASRLCFGYEIYVPFTTILGKII